MIGGPTIPEEDPDTVSQSSNSHHQPVNKSPQLPHKKLTATTASDSSITSGAAVLQQKDQGVISARASPPRSPARSKIPIPDGVVRIPLSQQEKQHPLVKGGNKPGPRTESTEGSGKKKRVTFSSICQTHIVQPNCATCHSAMEDLLDVTVLAAGSTDKIRSPSPQEEDLGGEYARVRLFSAEAHRLFERKREELMRYASGSGSDLGGGRDDDEEGDEVFSPPPPPMIGGRSHPSHLRYDMMDNDSDMTDTGIRHGMSSEFDSEFSGMVSPREMDTSFSATEDATATDASVIETTQSAAMSQKKYQEGFLSQFSRMVIKAKTDITEFVSSSVACTSPKRPGKSGTSVAGEGHGPPTDFQVNFEDIEELKFLGSGSVGCVFMGVLDNEKVAVKKFKDPNHLTNESDRLKTLDHPNVVRLLGVCTQPPVYCIVMELCKNSVFEVLRDRQIGPDIVCNWARQVATGMHYIHEDCSLVHRDLKSGNILIAMNGRTLKISDFGTTRKYGAKSTQMSFCGSVSWMAPEMVRSEPCSQMVDVWSFGVVLWELLTGQIPYEGVDTAAVIYGVGTGGLHLPVPTTTPLGFSLLLKQCFNVNPKHRPKFRQILLHLQIVEDDSGFLETPRDTYFETQEVWKHEVEDQFSRMKLDSVRDTQKMDDEAALLKRREQELKHAEDVRRLYEERLNNASVLLADIKARAKEIGVQQPSHSNSTTSSNGGSNSSRQKPRRRRSRSFLVNKQIGNSSRRGKSRRNQGDPPNSKTARLRRSLERAVLESRVLPDQLRVGSESFRELVQAEATLSQQQDKTSSPTRVTKSESLPVLPTSPLDDVNNETDGDLTVVEGSAIDEEILSDTEEWVEEECDEEMLASSQATMYEAEQVNV